MSNDVDEIYHTFPSKPVTRVRKDVRCSECNRPLKGRSAVVTPWKNLETGVFGSEYSCGSGSHLWDEFQSLRASSTATARTVV